MMNVPPLHPTSPELTSKARLVKRRASKACHECRTKKVRCSVVRSGIPCYSCLLANVQCTVSPYRKSRQRRNKVADIAPATSRSVAQPEDAQSEENDTSLGKFLAHPPQSLDFALSDYVPETTSADKIVNQGHNSHRNGITSGDITEEIIPLNSSGGQTAASSGSSLDISTEVLSRNAILDQANAQLPAYVRPLPPALDANDVIYLDRKGALTTFGRKPLTDMLRCFAEFVYPFMPIVDLRSFLEPLTSKNPGGRISLMLLHAVMYTAAAFVDEEILKDEGYGTRRAARRALFEKAKLLYDLGYDQDRLSVLQSLVLMTHYYETPEDQKGAWYWCGISLSFAYSLGLDREQREAGVDDPLYSLRKRLWWSCYMRDKLIALSVRRPPRIQDASFTTSLLEREDFDLEPFSDALSDLLGRSPIVLVPVRIIAAGQCVEVTKLCIHINHVLHGQYDVRREVNEIDRHTNIMMAPRQPELNLAEVVQLDDELQRWFMLRPVICQSGCFESGDEFSVTTVNILLFHAAFLEALFYSTSSVLHRQQALMAAPAEAEARTLWQLSRQRVKETTDQITRITKMLNERDLTRFLPPFGVTVVTTAALIHLVNSPPEHPQVFYKSHSGLQDCINALQILTNIYSSADYARSFLEIFARKRGLSILQEMSPYNYVNENGSQELPDPASASKVVNPRSRARDIDASDFASEPPAPEAEPGGTTETYMSADTSLDELENILGGFDGVIDFNHFFDFEEWLQF